ncbi:MAG: hypothetical protein ACM31L_11445 [Actinomycetota bacterium]
MSVGFVVRGDAAVAKNTDDSFAACPDWARNELDRRLASLQRGEGLTTDELATRMRVWREQRRRDSER